jgi:protein-arginine kinase activator protein McsA
MFWCSPLLFDLYRSKSDEGKPVIGQPKSIHLEATLNFPPFYYSADLQKAIDSENYALAAGLRDDIAKLEV